MTYIFLAVTIVISIIAFSNDTFFSKLMLNPYSVVHRKEYYRVLSHGFIHVDYTHLIVNMIVLYSFGTAVEQYFDNLTDNGYMRFPHLWYTALYILGMVVSSISTIIRHKNNSSYNSVGASGAVSAVLFCSIFFSPLRKLAVFFIVPMPGIIFGVIYLVYSQYMSKKNYDNINHEAHFVGAVFGFLFPMFINYKWLMDIFVNSLINR